MILKRKLIEFYPLERRMCLKYLSGLNLLAWVNFPHYNELDLNENQKTRPMTPTASKVIQLGSRITTFFKIWLIILYFVHCEQGKVLLLCSILGGFLGSTFKESQLYIRPFYHLRDYGHMMPKSPIFCGTNSNSNPKLIFGIWA